MKSLLNSGDNKEVIARINALTSQSKALWGKMTVSQMLAHCQIPFQIASGELKPKVNPIVRTLFGRSARKKLTTGEPFKRNLPTFSEALVTTDKEFEKEKNELLRLVQRFHDSGEQGITKEKHPFFGELTLLQWNNLQYNHLDHHLRQFGA